MKHPGPDTNKVGDVVINVDHVSKSFRLPHEKQSSIKGTLINLVRGGNRSYEEQKALNDVSFQVRKGDFFCIAGRNGSGKSTLLKMLAGIYAPTAGAIGITGRLTPFIELGVGFNPELTGRENVFLNGALLGFSRKEMEKKYDDIVDFAEIERFMDQKLKNYSSGMQVRLAFSIAIRAKSDILLLDEVLAVGDAAFQQKCFTYFEELKQDKQTVVFVSHDMDSVRRFCNRGVYIEDGNLLLEGEPTEIADMYAEKNIENAQKPSKKLSRNEGLPAERHKVSGKIVQQSNTSVQFDVAYDSKDSGEVYIGIALLREGISVAEINTVGQLKLHGKGVATYTLDISGLNGGVYQIGCGLYRLRNRELLAAGKSRSRFFIKGDDPTKGGALKLEARWDYAKD